MKFDTALYSKIDGLNAETLVVGVFTGETNLKHKVIGDADKLTGGSIQRFLGKNKNFGKLFDSVIFHISPKEHKFLEKVVLVGLGKAKDLDNYKLRQVYGFIGKNHCKDLLSLAICMPGQADIEKASELLPIGLMGGLFDSGHHKTESNGNKKIRLEKVTLMLAKESKQAKELIEQGLLISESIEKVREAVNLPANIVTPLYLVNFAKKIAKENSLKIEVFSEKQVNEMGMGIMASVARGSEEDLYFVVMRYLGGGSSAKSLALVGKGITFDSGGISIKPSESMEWMKMDMAGAAVMFGVMEVVAKLKPKINVICACPLTENLPSGKATKPGDVVRGLSGKTVEIINTDAEGRLVLSDALTYVQRNYKPDYIVDAATLTGASVVALGTLASAILGRPQAFVDKVMEAADKTGERLWQLPLYDEYRDLLKSYIADIANVTNSKGGGTETGAKFIEEFVEKGANWVHLDIAPTAWEESDKPYAVKGATGAMVTTLVELAENLSK